MPEVAASTSPNFEWLYFAVSFTLGFLVGAAEVIARYKDEPLKVFYTFAGWGYSLFNGVISAIGYFILIRYQQSILPSITNDQLLLSLFAGFGAMFIARSKLFTIRTENGDSYPAGPDAVISTFLAAVDREIDRKRSADRQKIVFENVKQINQPDQAPLFIKVALGSYQNLSSAEKEVLSDIISEIQSDNQLPADLRLVAISFALLNISGEENYKQTMQSLKERIGDRVADRAA